MLSVHIIETLSDVACIADEWRDLAETISPRLPFHTSDWLCAWWAQFRRAGFFARDCLRVFILRDATGALVAVAPMMLTLRPGIGPVRTRELQFIGADSNMTEIRGPLCRPSDADQVLATLRAHIARTSRCDWVQWRGLSQGPESRGADPRLIVDPRLCSTGYLLDMPESWSDFRSGLPRNIKESLRKCYNSLDRDGHRFAIRVIAAPDQVGAALDRFFVLHGRRARRLDTVPHLDVFKTPASRAFLRDFCHRKALRDELRIFEMVIAGEVVATRIGFQFADQLYLYYSGYDPAWSRYSVMTTVVAEAIRWAIAAGCSLVNLSTGTDVSKTRWRPRPVTYWGYYEPAAAMRSRATFRAVQHLRQRRSRAS